MLKGRAQAARVEVPDAHLAVCRPRDDRASARRPSGGTRAIDDADNVDENDSFHALSLRMTAQGRDDFTLAQVDDADAAFRAAHHDDRRGGVDG